MKKIILILLSVLILSGCAKEKATPAISTIETPEPIPVVEEIPEDIIKNVKMSVTGDIMVHSWQYNEAYDKASNTYDFSHNFSQLKQYFENSDLVIGNLETVFGGDDRGPQDFPMFNTPDAFGDALKDAGFNLLTTANNHSYDQGSTGLLRTIEQLDALGIEHFGTYASQEERDTIFVKEVNGIKIAFLSYTYGTNGIPTKEPYHVNIIDKEQMPQDIKRAKELADFVVVMPHMGNEYEEYVRDVFKEWVDLMFESGADVVFASHPHVLQPMEYKTVTDEDGTERECFVIYSLGNCISSQTTPPRNAGVLLNMEIQQINDEKPTIEQVSVIPIWTQFRNIN
ncbi:MAG: CapA family protein, partial [Anaerotignaceae bacterium]